MSAPIELDWGDVTPLPGVRARIEARVRSAQANGPSIALHKTSSGYEAELRGAQAECRLHDSDLRSLVDRAIDLIAMVERTPSLGR